MRSFWLTAWCVLVAANFACSSARETTQTAGTGGSALCFNCHSETTELGAKIQWAKGGYEESVHARGQVERVYTQVAARAGCPPFVQAVAATCTAQGGTHSTTGNICTMPAAATQAQCTAAGGTFSPAVNETGGANQCPTFAQAAAATPAAQTCTLAGGTFTAGTLACSGITTQNGCETAGGVWVGPRWVLTLTEKAGSNAQYANSGGCQMCHTEEGFRRRVAKGYDEPGASPPYSIQFSWDPRAQVGTSTTTPNTPLTRDVVEFPSPIGCFGCHTPHGIGTADNAHLDQTVPVGTVVTTQTGAVWGANKAKGHLCAECHQIRLGNAATVSDSIVANVRSTATPPGSATISGSYGPHHGPQTDMLLGKGGAEYAGSAGGLAFAGTYGNSAHTNLTQADCISCHMQSDVEDINLTGRLGVNPSIGGHSFTNKGVVHGAETVLTFGCGSVTGTQGCHTVSGVGGATGNTVRAANAAATNGYLQRGDAFFQKFNTTSLAAADLTAANDSKYHLQVNELLVKLANPGANCGGLLSQAAVAAGGALGWATMPDGVTIDPRCISTGSTKGIPRAAAPADDNTNAGVRLLKALWNFKFVLIEDKSFGVHNTTYALQLLYDSCTDLTLLTNPTACGPTAGRCTACEGTFVTARP